MSHPLERVYGQIDPQGSVLDVGCMNFLQVETANSLGLTKLKHFGVDYSEPVNIPQGFQFKNVDLNHERLPYDADQFDLVVAKHVIEHVDKPLQFFCDCIRVCKPGGIVYVEAPSERSLLLPGMPFDHDSFFSLSFFDDPTHMQRPWTPQSFHRLTRYYSCEPLKVGYVVSWKLRLLFPAVLLYALLTRNGKWLERCIWGTFGWASYVIVKKPASLRGEPSFRYHIPMR